MTQNTSVATQAAFPGQRSRLVHSEESRHYIKGNPARETLLPICFVSGEGEYLLDLDGNRYIDFSAGVAVPCGHSFQPVVRAIADTCAQLQACEDYTSLPRAELARLLSQIYPQLGGIQFYSSGTEAVEAGLRLMRAISGRDGFLAFYGSYHGKSLGSVSLAGMQRYNGCRASGFLRAPFANCYRCPYDKQYPQCALYCADRLPEIVNQQGVNGLAGAVIEPVQGFGGAVVPPPGYLRRVQELCHDLGALFMVDEVLTGIGRTGSMFAFEQFDLSPDVVTVGKGLGNGAPISAVLVHRKHRERIECIEGGTTYGGNPVSAAAAVATIKSILDNRLVERARALGSEMLRLLCGLESEFDCIGQVRGMGCLAAVEFVKDRATKQPDPDLARRVYSAACRLGLLTTPIGSIVRMPPHSCSL